MKAAFLLFLLCVAEAEADDIRWEMDAKFKQMNSSLEERLTKMASNLRASEEKVSDLQSRLNASENQVLELKKESEGSPSKADMWREVTGVRDKMHSLAMSVVHLRERMAVSDHQEQDLTQKNEEMAAELTASQKQVELLQTRLSTTENQLEVHHTKLNTTEDQIEVLHTRLTTTEDMVKNLDAESKEMAAELTASQKQVELLQTRLSTTENQLEVHHTRLNTTEDQIEVLHTRLTTTEDTVKNLEAESQAHGAQLSTVETRLNVSENKVQELSILLVNLDCERIAQSGVYAIYPTTAPVKVYCDMDTDGGKWTVIQRRVDGTVNFYRPWAQYKAGFGDASGEYWLGLENMHLLTKNKTYELRVDMEDFEGNTASASYSSFSVGSEADGYELQVAGFRDGGAGDSLTYHSGMRFTTFDKDQDTYGGNCASSYSGAFWYKDCHYVNINGVYQQGTTSKGVNWYHWKSSYYSLKAVAMKIRRVP